ncbi:MAG: hypothetical protein JO069_16070 [Verrucomicrobia bacterium]|nr:hypothetical protein [Verrucomicrobiota bacterium]
MHPVARRLCCAIQGLILCCLAAEGIGGGQVFRGLDHAAPGGLPAVPWTLMLGGILTCAVLALLRPAAWAQALARALGLLALVGATAFGVLFLAGFGPESSGGFWLQGALEHAGGFRDGMPGPEVLLTTASYGVAVVSYSRKGRLGIWMTALFTVAGLFFPMTSLVDYAYRATSFGSVAAFPPPGMPLASALLLLLIGLVLLVRYRDRAMIALFGSPAFGGKLIRRFFAAVVLAPIMLGWMLCRAQYLVGAKSGWSAVLMVSLLVSVYTALLFWIGYLADQHERGLVAQAQEREKLIAELREALAEITRLRSQLITICAWSSRIKNEERWMTLEEFLDKQLHLRISHGISEEALSELLTSVERDEWDRQEAARLKGFE